jgi:transcriptional regulator with XRE-family HTH domain
VNFEEILNRAIEASGATSDSDLSRKLGVSRQAVSNWRGGKKFPDTVTCATIAGITGIPLAQVLGVVGESRAISREEKAVWRRLAATAMILAIAVGFGGTPTGAKASPGYEKSRMYIM